MHKSCLYTAVAQEIFPCVVVSWKLTHCSHESLLGVIHILRNHQGGGGFWNDYANLMPILITKGGGGLEIDKK